MKKARWFTTLILALGLLMPLLAVPAGGLAQPVRAGRSPATMQSPPLGPFINIQDDTVDNFNPAMAYNSEHDEYLVVWEQHIHGGEVAIYGQRVGGDGSLKGGTITVIRDTNKWNWLPDVAYSPTQDKYLVVYAYEHSSTDYDIYARPVSWNGVPGTEFAIDSDGDKDWYPAVAYNSTNDEFLVVYEKYISGTRRDIEAQRVRASDWSLLSWRNIAGGTNQVRRLPDVAYNATSNEYLIAYTYQHATNGDIWGKVASHNMGTLSSEIYIVPNTNDQDGVALAAGPNEYLAVWADGPSATHRTIYGRRVTGTGTLHPYIPIADHSGQACVEPDVAYGPVYGYLVAWRYIPSTGVWDVYGRYVKPGQNSAWGSEFAIDDGADSQKSPALACDLFGDCLVVEEDNWPGADYEIRGRLVMAYHVYLPLTLRNFK